MTCFERRLLAHLTQLFPTPMDRTDPVVQRQLVRHFVERAQHWGWGVEAQVAAYAELAMRLHPRFDEHPDFGWAHEILQDEYIVSHDLRWQTLEAAAARHIARRPPAAEIDS